LLESETNEDEDDEDLDYDVEKEEAWRSIEDPLDTDKTYFRREAFTELADEWKTQRRIEDGEDVKFEKLKLLQEDGTEVDMDDEYDDELANIEALHFKDYKTSEEEYEEDKEWGLENDAYEESLGDKMHFYSMDTEELIVA